MVRSAWVAAIVAIAVVAGLYFVFFQPGGPAQPGVTSFDVEVKQRKLTMNPPIVRVTQGDEVNIRIRADERGEFHVPRPYDVEVKVEPGRVALLTFNATLPGRFDLEWHPPALPGQQEEEIVIGALEVQPKR